MNHLSATEQANNIGIDPMSTHELDAENLEKEDSAFCKMSCDPGGRPIVIIQQSQNGDGNGENDLNNQHDLQQPNRKIGTFDLCVKPKKKVRVAACDRRIKMLKKVMKAETLETFLEALGFGKYSLIFRSEEFDMSELLHVDESDLVHLGIPVGPGRSILQALKYKA